MTAASRVFEAMRDFGAEPAPPASARVWSDRQLAIFDTVPALAPGSHLVIEALAGTGKSTTIEECVERIPHGPSVLVCAFNKSIAQALLARLPSDVDTMTLHSLGSKIVRSAMGSRDLERFYVSDKAKELLGAAWDRREARTACAKLVGLAKGTLAPADPAELDELADEYGIEFPRASAGVTRGAITHAAAEILEWCRRQTGPIDFDDMIWLPHVRDLPAPTWDYVFVDETQDLNAAQLSLVRRVAGDEGRIIAVGDRRQAIYGFRGADREAIPRMIRELKARTLPLDITYRCPRRVVREANEWVPELKAAPTAPEGIVRRSTDEALRDTAQPGDMVLSRINAPLVSLCYRWLSQGRRAMIQGRDVGEGLISWIRGANAASVGQLMCTVADWRAKEVARLTKAERDCSAVLDKAECIEALCEGAESVAGVIDKAERLFGEAASTPANAILLSSTHRAKGLEADRVWLLRDTYLRWEGIEEENLLYVAITRAKRELIYVTADAEIAEGDAHTDTVQAWLDSEERH